MMQKCLVILVCCLLSLAGFSQVRITLIDKFSGKGLEGVALYLKDPKNGNKALEVSDQDGKMVVSLEKPSTLVTSHISYASREIEVISQTEIIIELEPRSTQLESTVVTGQYEPTSLRQSVYKVRVIDEERIKAQGASRLQDVLSTELNIRFSEDATLGVSTISMQGLSGQNVKVLIDGVPVVGRQGQSNAFDLNQININTIERIEIVEGPMSTVYGADALAGVINIITKKTTEEKFTALLKLHEESIGDEYSLFEKGIHQQNINLGYKWKSWYTSVDAGHNYSGGWQGDSVGREKQWHPKRQWLTSGVAGINKENWNAWYRLDYLNESIYNPAEFIGSEALDQNYSTNRFMHQLQAAAELSGKWSFNGALSYTDYQRKTQTVVVDEATGEETLSLGEGHQDITKYDGATVRGTFQYKISNKVSLQPGFDVNFESGSGGRLKQGENGIEDYALFLSAEVKPFSFLSIRPGIRLVKNSVYQAPPFIPSINTKIQLSPSHDMRLSYAQGFRSPSIRELYFDFFDASHSIEGNPALEAELSHSVNASWNWYVARTTSFSYTSIVSGFYNAIDNMIVYGQKPGNSAITTYINVAKYKSQGITWNNTLQLGNTSLTAGIGYTGRYNEYASDSEGPEFTWSPEVNSTANYRFSKVGITASFFYKYTGQTPFYERSNDGSIHLAETEGYHLADFTLQKTFLSHYRVNIGVRNFFDVTQVQTTSRDSGTHSGNASNSIGSGRSFFATLLISFANNRKLIQ